jgi:hypothetical protein
LPPLFRATPRQYQSEGVVDAIRATAAETEDVVHELKRDEAMARRALDLCRFVEGEVLPWFETPKQELANRPPIRQQAFGEALDPIKLERLGRYEVHLDRKLERMLAMLLRLKDLRQWTAEGKSVSQNCLEGPPTPIAS